MPHKCNFIFTLKGFILGIVLLGIFVATPITIIITHFFSELDSDSVGGVVAGVVGGASVICKKYWDWADRVMAKLLGLFGYKGDKQAG